MEASIPTMYEDWSYEQEGLTEDNSSLIQARLTLAMDQQWEILKKNSDSVATAADEMARGYHGFLDTAYGNIDVSLINNLSKETLAEANAVLSKQTYSMDALESLPQEIIDVLGVDLYEEVKKATRASFERARSGLMSTWTQNSDDGRLINLDILAEINDVASSIAPSMYDTMLSQFESLGALDLSIDEAPIKDSKSKSSAMQDFLGVYKAFGELQGQDLKDATVLMANFDPTNIIGWAKL